MTNRRIIYKPIPEGIQQLVRKHGGGREAVLEILSELAQMFSNREFRSKLAQASDAIDAQRLIVGWQTDAPH